MNYHLLVIHFPIALVVLYSGLEIISFKKVRDAFPFLFYTKALLIIIGALGTWVARQTGELIEEKFDFVKDVVTLHSFFGTTTAVITTVVAVLYLLVWLHKDYCVWFQKFPKLTKVVNFFTTLHTVLFKRWLLLLGAILALASVTITGALGGAIAHGFGVDPLAQIFYDFFSKYLL